MDIGYKAWLGHWGSSGTALHCTLLHRRPSIDKLQVSSSN